MRWEHVKQLVNVDKHRSLLLTTVTIWGHEISMRADGGRREVTRRAVQNVTLPISRQEKLSVEAYVGASVRFGSMLPSEPAGRVIEPIYEGVANTVPQFDRFFTPDARR